ncbi:hypothetical protein PV10_00249 [Exophiala mesophila]|uniref:Uncharacterized protein n=1 Tax=Exophiala mesophila TaxID=212818 RepID=A0A0D2ABR5_EXOME|nr:uncharacterized protein PV10_00249 [Exophiala mesophila]KIV96368.1 hypothetical protein PV10_00249 [Exophiala mesophila]
MSHNPNNPTPTATTTALHPLHGQISSQLASRHSLVVSPNWLTNFLSSRGANLPPLPALVSTAHFRILASDITTSLSPAGGQEVLPRAVDDVNVKELRLQASVLVQVLDVVDVGSSKWSQVEAIERVERGEEIRGREVIRTVGGMTDDDDTTTTTNSANTPTGAQLQSASKLSAGPHKLVLQDAKGVRVMAFELVKIPKIGLSTAASASLPTATVQPQRQNNSLQINGEDPGTFIGVKLLLSPGTLVRRGMVMLTPDTCVVLGGKVDAWDKKWKADRKATLTALVAEAAAG